MTSNVAGGGLSLCVIWNSAVLNTPEINKSPSKSPEKSQMPNKEERYYIASNMDGEKGIIWDKQQICLRCSESSNP